jgi:hypothetical protein
MIVLDRTRLVEIFVMCDDFVKKLRELPSYSEEFMAMEESQMSKSELMTIVVFYHYAGFRCVKWYYEAGIQKALRSYFPQAFSYSHFVNSMRLVYQELVLFLFLCCMRQPTEANYVDSKSLKVCHIKREKQHKVFADSAKKGKTSVGWFDGFKLHNYPYKNNMLKRGLSSNLYSNSSHINLTLTTRDTEANTMPPLISWQDWSLIIFLKTNHQRKNYTHKILIKLYFSKL